MVAVVAIVLGDLAAWPVGGFVGIDMFFVISGFLITGLLVKEYSSTGRVSLGGFYRNRIRRAVPAAALTLVVTVGAAWIVFDAERFLATAIDGSWAGLLVANWHAIAVGADPFQPVGPGSPLDHYWALAVVGQFYLVWPLLLLGSLFLLGRRGAGSRTTEVMPGLGTVLASLTALSFGWALWQAEGSTTVAHFSSVARIWELGVGALIAVYAGAFTRLGRWGRMMLGYGGLAGIVVSLATLSEGSGMSSPWAALPVLSTAAVIVAGTSGPAPPLWFLTNPVSAYVGTISYSLYLWHVPVIVLGTAMLGDGPVERAGYAIALTLAAIYTYHLVEDPIRRSNWLRGPHGRKRRGPRILTPGYKLAAVSLLAISAVTVSVAALTVHSFG